jgi:predicted nucleic acid-binding protein
VKRYLAEPGSDAVRAAMDEAEDWFTCRVGFVETARALGRAAGARVAQRFEREWPSFTVVEVDQALVEHAAALTRSADLRSLDAMHLAAALLLPAENLALATYDRRLHAAAREHDLRVIPQELP